LLGFAFIVKDPKALETVTIRGADASFNKDKNACVTASVPKTLVFQTVRSSLIDAILGFCDSNTSSIVCPSLPVFEIAALLTNKLKYPASARIFVTALWIESLSAM